MNLFQIISGEAKKELVHECTKALPLNANTKHQLHNWIDFLSVMVSIRTLIDTYRNY